jgi:hypothetical protein
MCHSRMSGSFVWITSGKGSLTMKGVNLMTIVLDHVVIDAK